MGDHLSQSATVPFPTKNNLLNDFPEITNAAFIFRPNSWGNNSIIKYEDKESFEDNFIFAERSFLEIYDLKFIEGDPESALDKVNEILLTESTAKRYFGDEKALDILKEIGEQFSIPVITDVHSEDEARLAAQYVDVLQIPAFLCRQTDLLVAAAKTGKPVKVKKGQFMAPEDMRFAVVKAVNGKNVSNLKQVREYMTTPENDFVVLGFAPHDTQITFARQALAERLPIINARYGIPVVEPVKQSVPPMVLSTASKN